MAKKNFNTTLKKNLALDHRQSEKRAQTPSKQWKSPKAFDPKNIHLPTLAAPKNTMVGLLFRSNTPAARDLTAHISNWMINQKIDVALSEPLPSAKTKKRLTESNKTALTLLIAVGGDGTYLRAARYLDGQKVPILGINMGSLGFLTAFSPETAPQAIADHFAKKLKIQNRSLLKLEVIRNQKKIANYNALNDIVIERGSHSQLIETSISHTESIISRTKADGFIIATPTGSTAYNLAAGGPILHPETPAFILNFVAPHSLTTRPIILPQDEMILLRLNEDRRQQAKLIVDGESLLELKENDIIKVSKSEKAHQFLQPADYDFFRLLRSKLKFGERD